MQGLAFLEHLKTRVPMEHRITAALISAFVAIVFCLYIILTAQFKLVFLFIAAIVGFLVAYLGGTKLCLVLYFATTFGSAIRFPFLPTSGNRLAALLLFLAILLELPWKKLRWNWALPGLVFSIFNVFYLTVAAVKITPEVSYPFESLFYIMVYTLIVVRFWEKENLRYLFVGIGLATAATIVLPGFLEIVLRRDITTSGFRGSIMRINGLSVNAIIYAYYAVWSLPFVLTLAISSKYRFQALLYLSLAASIVLVCLATLNRQTPILMAVMLMVFFWYMRTPYRKRIITVCLFGGLLFAPFLGVKIIERFSTATDIKKDPSLMVRRDKTVIAMEMVKENFWTGVGHNYFPQKHHDYYPEGKLYLLQFMFRRDQWIDFGYMQILTEYGAIGAGMFLLLIIVSYIYFRSCYRKSLQLDDPFLTNVFATVASLYALLLVSNLIQDTFVTPKTYMMIAILLAAGTLVNLELEAQQNKQELDHEASTS